MYGVTAELLLIRRAVMRFLLVFIVLAGGMLTLQWKPFELQGFTLPWFGFGSSSIAESIFLSAKMYLIPSEIPVVALGPVSVFLAPIIVSILMTFLIIFPYGIWLILDFFLPALREHERKTIVWAIVPSIGLFYAGSAFGFFLLLPITYRFLFSFADQIGVVPYFSLDEFLSSVFVLIIATGLVFLLPVFMRVITWIGLLPNSFWWKHWRAAFVFILIFAAIVTPDGSGITMILLSFPLCVLYGIGMWGAKKKN